MLNLLEELLLLALDDEKGKIISSSSLALPYGLSGAILLEFSLELMTQYYHGQHSFVPLFYYHKIQ